MIFDFSALHELHQHASAMASSMPAVHTHAQTMVLAAKAAGAKSPADQAAARAGCYIGAGLAMTGALGVGFGQGYVGGKAALAVAKNPDEYSRIRAMMLIGAAIAESSAIYALIIAILLIFVAPSL